MSVASLIDQFPLLATAPEGVKRLRELILGLAVRGKLVSQNPSDEPASELLKRIQAEKARLVEEGKIRKDKPLPEIGAEEKPFELPAGWEFARLGEVVEIVRGITFPSSEKSRTAEAGRVACLRTANVQDQLEWDDLLFIKEKFIARDDQYLQPLDIVMSMANSRELVGKVALTDSVPHDKATFGGFLGVLRPISIDPRFVMALLRTPTARSELIDSASQTTNIANIGIGKLRPLLLAVPPLAEQHRIVAKVDELMALCDRLETQQADAASAHATLVKTLLDTLTRSPSAADFAASWQRIAQHFDTLFTTEASLDALKQTVLQLAVMGKLVPQDPSDEPASVLLKRIQAEKAKLVAEGKIRKDKPLPEIGEDEKPFELPVGWEWVRFGNTSDFINGDRSKNYPNRSEYVENGVAWINTGHIEPNGRLTTIDMNFVSREKFDSLNSGKIQRGDLVYCLRGATFGKTAFVDPYEEGAIASSLMIVRPVITSLNKYIFQFLVSPLGKQQLLRFDNGSAQPNLSASNVTLYAFPLPPLAEQHRIVVKVDELMALCDRLAAALKAARELAAHYASAATTATLEAA